MSTQYDECEKEQLHLSNGIQGFGCLIAIDENDIITHYSENIFDYFKTLDEVVGQPISNILNKDISMDSGVSLKGENRKAIFGIKTDKEITCDLLITSASNARIIEIQPSVENINQQPFSMGAIPEIMSYGDLKISEDELLSATLKNICDLTGFDKAMIYKFQDDWSGEVIAERDENNVFQPYFGLRFPASDIPQIARDLYCKTPYRLIADSKSNATPIVSKKTEKTIDLTFSDLRSVSPVHLEYLQNMGVRASLSFSIMLNDQLWGLIALHHCKARYISLGVRNFCAEITSAFALTMKARQTTERMNYLDTLDRKISKILSKIDFKSDPMNLTQVETELLEMTGSSGGAIIVGNDITPLGKAPSSETIKLIDNWYQKEGKKQTISTDCISDALPETLEHKDVVCGVIGIHSYLKTDENGLRFYWFRPSLVQEIKWAGKPEKIVNAPNSQFPISPRRSFELWTEITQAKSQKWSQKDLTAVAKFRAFVLKAILK